MGLSAGLGCIIPGRSAVNQPAAKLLGVWVRAQNCSCVANLQCQVFQCHVQKTGTWTLTRIAINVLNFYFDIDTRGQVQPHQHIDRF